MDFLALRPLQGITQPGTVKALDHDKGKIAGNTQQPANPAGSTAPDSGNTQGEDDQKNMYKFRYTGFLDHPVQIFLVVREIYPFGV